MNTANQNFVQSQGYCPALCDVLAHAALIPQLWLKSHNARSWYTGLVPTKYAAALESISGHKPTALNLTGALRALGKVKPAAWGKLPGLQTKEMVNQICVGLIRGLISELETVAAEAYSFYPKVPYEVIETATGFKVPQRIETVLAILDCEGIHIACYGDLRRALDNYVAMMTSRPYTLRLAARLVRIAPTAEEKARNGRPTTRPEDNKGLSGNGHTDADRLDRGIDPNATR